MPVKLSIVIATFNRATALANCLDSLTKQTFSNFEVIVIDGGSTDNTPHIINQFRSKLNLKLITDPRPQLAQIRDRGWRVAAGQYVAWIDDDVVVCPNWAHAIVTVLDNNPKIGGVTGPTIIPSQLLAHRDVFIFYHARGLLTKILAYVWENLFLEGDKYAVGKILKSGAWTPGSNFASSLKITGLQPVDYLEACNMTLRKNLVHRVGGFDLGYVGIGEWSELDLSIRIKKLGYQLVFHAKACLYHHISQQGVYPRRTQARHRMVNFLKFYFRHIFHPQPTYFLKFFAYLLFLNAYWGYKAVATKNLNWLGGWLGTIEGLIKHAYDTQ